MSYTANWFKDFAQTHETFKHSIAGAGAGLISSIITCPFDVVKTKLQNQSRRDYRGTIGTFKSICIEEGLSGFYRGLTPTVVGYLPTWAIYFTVYDVCKNSWTNHDLGQQKSPWLIHISSALTAGLVSTTLTSPVWVIKTRFMSQTVRSSYRYNNLIEAFIMIAKHEGVRGFYKGLGPSLIGVSHVAIQFPMYEKFKSVLSTVEGNNIHAILIASALSKMIASTTTYPHEVVRTRLQNQISRPFKYKGLFHAVKVILYEEGMYGFYKGLQTNLIRTVPASAATILTYEYIVDKLQDTQKNK
ncbi:mitochondrial carrier domain-containing protein [Gilbertella persicaria]|uniref:mitochondrial carrier domain-containing protein n=1 Tax=Gilbertella persicaria TaxID=101096 RepID=UPI00222047A9|nr:mitochondrial carrier domain-containing protein [Gilbertella persicaria]KAI8084229.1 mitochondrial carrier domain-containing protein [Gilbertella persicaria]